MPRHIPISSSLLLMDPATQAVNARGQLSPLQQAALSKALWTRGLVSVAGLGLLLLLGLLCASSLLIATAPTPPAPYSLASQFLALFPPALAGFWLLVLLPLLLWDLLSLFHLLRFWLTPRRSQVQVGEGTLLWDRHYLARIPGQRDLRHISGGSRIENLLPGVYRFYYLPSLGWVLSAIWLGTPVRIAAGSASAAPSLPEVLAQTNGFVLAALPLNRAGQLSPEQARMVQRVARRLSFMWLFLGLGVWGAGLALLINGWARGQFSTGLLLGVMAWGGLFLVLVLRPGPIRRDIQAGRVLSIQGVGEKYTRTRRTGQGTSQQTRTYYYYQIADQSFEVTSGGYEALVVGLPYRAYYLPRSKRLVNIELLARP
ncbi:MAG TPA: hypothetical protein VKT82_08620 [Ktedonobacterales bacterium]|nr:hypothetical protein [Ktedonobacterales bacterium]